LELFAACAAALEQALGRPVRLESDPTRSGPVPGEPDPFRSGSADLAFLCAPSYLWLAASAPPVVDLVPAAFVFDDPRAAGRPVYFADVVVASRSRARTFDDLRGARWVYNDPASLSGYFSVLGELHERGEGLDFFRQARPVGSHHAALEEVASGTADCAAIDSNTLLLARRRGACSDLRVVQSLGPYPVQPIVVRADLGAELKATFALALLSTHRVEPFRSVLERCGVLRLAPVSPADYAIEDALLRRAARCPAVAGGQSESLGYLRAEDWAS
jgi:ABC-type phosphate/phosphonate transport system substrate-binding protein